MLNPSDPTMQNPAGIADIAQYLRGSCAFGAVAFHEVASLGPEHVYVELGYGDCLPQLDGGVWRAPALATTTETMK